MDGLTWRSLTADEIQRVAGAGEYDAEGNEIVVRGYAYGSGSYGGGGYGQTSGDDSSENDASGYQQPSDCEMQEAAVEPGASAADLEANALKIIEKIIDLVQRIGALDVGSAWTSSDGKSVSAFALFERLRLADLTVIDQQPTDNDASGLGSGGYSIWTGSDMVLQVWDDLLDDYSEDDPTLTWYVLHEIVHAMPDYLNEWNANFSTWTNGQAEDFEARVSSMAQAIAASLGLATMPNPGGGYSAGVTHTYTPGTHGTTVKLGYPPCSG